MRLTEEEKDQLASENFAYIHYFSKKYHTPKWDYEEIVGAASVGMTKALNTFDKSKGIKFSTYSARCIINAIFMFMRREKKHLNNISIDQPIASDKDGNKLTIIDTLTSSEAGLDWREISPIVNEVLSQLPELKRKIMEMFFENKSQIEIGKSVGLSQSYIARIIGKVLKQMKETYWRGEKEVPNKSKLQITVEEFVSMRYKDKMPFLKIAQIKGVSEASIHNWKSNHHKEIQEMVRALHLANDVERGPLVDSKISELTKQKLTKEIAELKSSLQSRDAYINSRESLIETLESRVVALEQTKSIYANLEEDNRRLLDENEKLKESNANQEFSIKQFERLTNENKDLRQEIEALKYFARRYLAV